MIHDFQLTQVKIHLIVFDVNISDELVFFIYLISKMMNQNKINHQYVFLIPIRVSKFFEKKKIGKVDHGWLDRLISWPFLNAIFLPLQVKVGLNCKLTLEEQTTVYKSQARRPWQDDKGNNLSLNQANYVLALLVVILLNHQL